MAKYCQDTPDMLWNVEQLPPHYVISSSGGIGSAISAILAYEAGLPFDMVFANTKVEDPDLYRFQNDVAVAVEKEIIWLEDGRDPYEVFVDNKWIGNTQTAHCSQELKTDQVRKWIDKNRGENAVIVLGMDWSELDRIERAMINWHPRPIVSLLNEMQCLRPTWAGMLAKYNIKPARLYEMGFPHNNCGGGCCRAGLKQWATVLEKLPDVFEWHAARLKWAMDKIGPTAKPFLRHTVNGETNYLTLYEFKEQYLAGKINVSPYDWGGCGCFVDAA